MTELFNYFLINLLGSFILKIYTCKPLKFLFSHLKNVGEKYYSEYASLINLSVSIYCQLTYNYTNKQNV